MVAVGIGWYGFSVSRGRESFFEDCIVAYVFCAPIAAMTLTQSPVLFWISLVLTLAWGVLGGVDSAPSGTSDWQEVLIGVYSAWVVAGSVITLGSTSMLPYSQPALALSEIHLILDARLLLTSFLVLFLGDSMVRAFGEGPPVIRPLPDIRISETANSSDPMISSIMQPIIVILNVMLLVVQRITNAIWHVIALLCVYLYRTGANLANLVVDLLSTSRLWLELVRVIASFLAVVVFATLVQMISSDVVVYMRSDTSLGSISAQNFWTLTVAAVLFGVTVAIIVALCALWGVRKRALNQASYGGAMLLVAGWLSGGLIYVLSYTGLFRIIGFGTLGLYSLLLILFVGSVFLFQVLKRVAAR